MSPKNILVLSPLNKAERCKQQAKCTCSTNTSIPTVLNQSGTTFSRTEQQLPVLDRSCWVLLLLLPLSLVTYNLWPGLAWQNYVVAPPLAPLGAS